MSLQTGLSEQSLNFIRASLENFLKHKIKTKIFVFGSRANDHFKKYSDLDLWIESKPSLTDQELAEISDYFKESDLPITIDIVTPENCLDQYKERIQNEMKLWFVVDGI